MSAKNLLDLLLDLSSKVDLTKIPILYAENVNGKTYISQASFSEVMYIDDVQELPESFEVELNTQSDMGVFIGTFPKLD